MKSFTDEIAKLEKEIKEGREGRCDNCEPKRYCDICEAEFVRLETKLSTLKSAQQFVNETIDESFEWWGVNNVFKIKQWKWLKEELRERLGLK